MKWKIPEPDPLWYKDAIIYEVHVKAFYDSTNDGIGDFRGLIQKLDYLQELGITAIWLLPFYPSPLRDDGYDIADYHGVHPSYGTIRDFRQFVREAHRRGMRVITELVVNHTSDQHPWFQASRAAPPGSSKRDFYVWSDNDQKYRDARIIFTDTETSNWTFDPVAKAYYWHRFFHHQPDLNYDNPLVLRAIIKIMSFWLDLGVDGLRLDAVPYLIERDGTSCENLPGTHLILKEIRRQLDASHQDRMLLAEANQWPPDVLPYFGDGDECHMAFHFPLMPRIFMALRQEDRHPISEIMRQTPDIPPSCQWCLFLRNHDELTLEMVTDEERDYMYREYATDRQMRINIGIRRRLAPLMNNSRRRIELLYSLLFSFPGTPVIYYGDEIGMGDNIYLGDRNGVRTPMQWTGDRNAGFSRADAARLYSPIIVDPVYGYQAINVEAQERDPSSLLNWLKQLIALRRRTRTFGRGSLELLPVGNRKVLAYIRRHEEEIILAVANLSRFVQPAELDLSAFAGMTPVEMIGRTEFPRVGELPYFLTLAPHSFFWFQLQRAPRPGEVAGVRGAEAALPLVVHRGPWSKLLEGSRESIEEVLPQHLARQRWFGGKARTVRAVRVTDWALFKPEPPIAFVVFAEVEFEDGGSDLHLVLPAVANGPGADQLLETAPASVMARLTGPEGQAVLHDALADDGACSALLAAIAEGGEVATQTGTIHCFPTAAFAESAGPPEGLTRIVRGSAATSNSSVLYGGRLILKLFRRIEPGRNPDLEIGLFLTERARFNRVPRTVGAIEHAVDGREPTTLGILNELIKNEGNGWDHALEELRRYFERAGALAGTAAEPTPEARPLVELLTAEPPAVFLEMAGPYRQAAGTLGRRTAEMHRALASDPRDPAFAPEPLTSQDFSELAESLRGQAAGVMTLLEDNQRRLPPELREPARRLIREHHRLLNRVSELYTLDLVASKIRCHGDYHLGQVLWAENDFYILDFEGEPARPLAERRAKASPLKDVAGMLRSFSYAAYAGLFAAAEERPGDADRLERWARVWERWVSAAFLRDYLRASQGPTLVPDQPAQLAALLDVFLLEKALYELRYELNSRPDFVRIPLLSLLALL